MLRLLSRSAHRLPRNHPFPSRGAANTASTDSAASAGGVDIFDGALYAPTRAPLDKAMTLPAHVYNDPAWFARELTDVFRPSWTLVGREDEVAKPGSFLTLDTLWGGSVIVVRDGKTNALGAFANVCRHRGAKLVNEEAGCARHGTLRCPYHAWVYDTTGALRAAPGISKQAQEGGFDKSQWGLKPVRLASHKGFLYVCVDEAAPPLEASLDNMNAAVTGQYGFEDLVCVGRASYDVPCNWKLLVENTSETYHTSAVHAATLGPMASRSLPLEQQRPGWNAVVVPTKGGRSVVPMKADAAPFPNITTLGAEQLTHFVMHYPSQQMNCTTDCMWWMRCLPMAVDRTQVTMGFCFPRATTERPDFERELSVYRKRWHLAVEEDNGISVNQQHGLASPAHSPGPFYVLREFGVHAMNRWLLDQIFPPTPPS